MKYFKEWSGERLLFLEHTDFDDNQGLKCLGEFCGRVVDMVLIPNYINVEHADWFMVLNACAFPGEKIKIIKYI